MQEGFARKVKHGTPIHDKPSLCTSCRRGVIVKGLAESERHTYCHAIGDGAPFEINYQVDECSCYDDKSTPPLYEMQAMAWKIATDRNGRKIGFLRPKEYERMSKEGKLDEHPDD